SPAWRKAPFRGSPAGENRPSSVAFLLEVESNDPENLRGPLVESNRRQGVVRRRLHETAAVGPAECADRTRHGAAGRYGRPGGGWSRSHAGTRRHGAPLHPAFQPPR